MYFNIYIFSYYVPGTELDFIKIIEKKQADMIMEHIVYTYKSITLSGQMHIIMKASSRGA